MTRWDKSGYLSAWRTDVERFIAATAADGLAREVPSCPDWTLRELVAHLARTFGTISRRANSAEAPPPGEFGQTVELDAGEDVLGEFEEAVTKTATSFDGLRLDTPAWNPAPLAKTAEFWFRRLMCETAVHRWDAQMAGAATEPIDGMIAAAGIEEAFDALVPMGRRTDDSSVSGVLQLFATDIDRQWFVRLREGRESLLDSDSIDVDNTTIQASASGTASDLYLALWGRLPVDVLDLAGAETLFRAVRVH